MKEFLKKDLQPVFVIFGLSIVFAYVVTLLWTGQIEMPDSQIQYSGKTILTDGEELDLEEFLVRVIAAQIPGEYEPAALEAQAILSRTYLYKMIKDAGQISAKELGVVYAAERSIPKEYLERYRNAVKKTAGRTIMSEGEYIEPMFHRAAVERTRTGDEAHKYLQSVESDDVEAAGYLTITVWEKKKLAESIGISSAESLLESIQIVEREENGYINTLQIGGNLYTGEEIAAKLSLNSTCFSFEAYEDRIRIVTKGIGHGFGMSQWGANRFAASGKNAEEILSCFFQNIQMVTE